MTAIINSLSITCSRTKKHIDMSNENTSVAFSELTAKEQEIVSKAIGWDGNQYHDSKSGITIELVNGDVASYRVLSKGDQVEAPAEEVQATEPAPEAPAEATAPATETAPENTEATSEQTTTEPAPENAATDVAPANTEATEPAPAE